MQIKNYISGKFLIRLFTAAFVLSISVSGCGGGGGSGGSGANGGSETVTVSAKGGAGGGQGLGGNGGNFTVAMADGTGHIETGLAGTANADFSADLLSEAEIDALYDGGANGFHVQSDTTVIVVAAAAITDPPLGTLYIVDGEFVIRISNENTTVGDETAVTGLRIDSGVTLTFELNRQKYVPNDHGYIHLDNDIINYGTIKSVDYDGTQKGHLTLSVGKAFYNMANGVVTSSATQEGQAAGDASLSTQTELINFGTVSADGFNATSAATDGSSGGFIYLTSDSEGVVNTGNVSSEGGTSTQGSGGTSGGVEFYPAFIIYNSGDITANGGDGYVNGGSGANVLLHTQSSTVKNSGNLYSKGGQADTGTGGSAGAITLSSPNDSVYTSGNIYATGGNAIAVDQNGGNGGAVAITANRSGGSNSHNVELSGILSTGGGNANTGAASTASGGAAGAVTIASNNSGTANVDHIKVYLQTIDTSGHTGETGGSGGNVTITHNGSGDIANSAMIITEGGNGDVTGGKAGYLDLITTNGDITNSGNINTSGGDGATLGGNADSVTFWAADASNAIVNSGTITGIGGDANPLSGGSRGGDGSCVSIDTGAATGTGNITADGNQIDSSGGAGETPSYDGGVYINGLEVHAGAC